MNLSDLSPRRRQVHDTWWHLLWSEGNPSTKRIVASLGVSLPAVSAALRDLRNLRAVPPRDTGSNKTPDAYLEKEFYKDWPLAVELRESGGDVGEVVGGAEAAPQAPTEPPEQIVALRRQLSDAQRLVQDYQRDQGGVQLLMQDILEHVEAIPAPKIKYKRPAGKKVSKPIALCINSTDWHMGAVQDADEIEGFNSFSPEILRKRIVNFAGDVLEWTALHRHGYTVDECRILVTSDLISGDIHDELRVTNAFPLPVQIVEAGRLLAEMTSLLSPHFDRVVIDAILCDNHGRLTKKLQHKQGGYNTANYPLAIITELMLRDHSNVEVNIYPREQQVVSVKGRNYLICHGHQIRGWAGFPYYGIERKVGKEAAKRMDSDVPFHLMVLGHFHAPLAHPWYWIGGSASGTDAYDHSAGRHSPPIQSAWFVHPKHGEFDRTEWVLHED